MQKETPTNAAAPNSEKALNEVKWTIIVLMAAESNLEEDFKEVYDQMARVGSNQDEVNFVVIFDGLNLPATPDGRVTVYHVIRNNFFHEVTEKKAYVKRFPERLDDLSDPKNLHEVLLYVKKKFPANHYG